MIVLVSLFSFSCSSTSSLFFLIFSLSSATLYLTLKSSCVGRSKSNFNSFSNRTGLFTSTCFIYKSFSALRFFSEREDPITVTSFREFNSSKNPSIFWLRSFFALSFSVPVLPHCFETLWEDYQRVTSRLLLRKEQDQVKLVLPPSQESQQDRTIEEPRNIALLGQQEC